MKIFFYTQSFLRGISPQMTTSNQSEECKHPIPERDRFGIIIISGTRCTSMKCSVHSIIPDYSTSKQICKYREYCTRPECMRIHTIDHMMNQIKRIKREKPKSMLHWLESMSVDEFRHFFSIRQQWDFFDEYRMREIYRPLETHYHLFANQVREQQLREQQLREQQLREQQLREQQLLEQQLRDQQLREQQLREQLFKIQMFQQNYISNMLQQGLPNMMAQFSNPSLPVAFGQAMAPPMAPPIAQPMAPSMASPMAQPMASIGKLDYTIDRTGRDMSYQSRRDRSRSRSRERQPRPERIRYF